jgi:CheY-like chemotaxis protein
MSAHNPEKLKVLVVDDEAVIADTLPMILRKHGYRTDAAYSATDAIDQASKQSVDWLITDVVMEDEMTGIDAAIEILKTLPNCKILLMSGDVATAGLLMEAHDNGYDFEILPKPFNPNDVLDKLKSMSSNPSVTKPTSKQTPPPTPLPSS